MTVPWLNTIGLLLGMLGVVILFIWGPTKRHKRRYDVMPRVGLGLIGLGFFVQLVATWL